MCDHWWVTTPEFKYIEPVLDDGSGPEEIGVDYINVEAKTKREAIVKGVKELRERTKYSPDKYYGGNPLKRYFDPRFSYYGWYMDREENPFKGVKAERTQCKHGFCFAEEFECPEGGEDMCQQCWDDYRRFECKHEIESATGGEEEHCWTCLTPKKQIEEWAAQKLPA